LTESVEVNGKIYVALESNLSCCQPDLWTTDGTASGTVQIDSNEGYPWHLQPSSLRAFGNFVALLTDTENDGTELSVVNTKNNALSILDRIPGPGSGASYGSTIAVMDGFILYLSGDPNNGQQLWRSDGTLAGTEMVMDMGPGVQSSQLSQDIVMTRVGDRAIFQSENSRSGPQLWSSDGTVHGTVPLISTPTPSFYVQPLLGVVGNQGYYAVYTGSDYRVVVTDGTAAGTHVLTNIGPLDPNGLGVYLYLLLRRHIG
jgi:ELWxxDGT repeat protein